MQVRGDQAGASEARSQMSIGASTGVGVGLKLEQEVSLKECRRDAGLLAQEVATHSDGHQLASCWPSQQGPHSHLLHLS